MEKRERFLNGIILLLVVGIAFLAVNKFVLNKPGDANSPRIENPSEIIVHNLDGSTLTFTELTGDKETIFCLFFDLTNCQTCIFQGIEELKSLEKNGKNCVAIAVHDWIEEIQGWSKHYDLKHFAVVKKPMFFEYIQSPFLPVIIKLKNGKITGFKYIHI